jgi:SAM-dependent methyltransferase
MAELDALDTLLAPSLGPAGLAALPPAHREWLAQTLGTPPRWPTLERLWALMDAAWAAKGCDPLVMDERIGRFYAHPVWLLNALFIEQDAESLAHRRLFADWAAEGTPRRVADIGGGGGTLARAVAAACPGAEVHVVEPHPHPAMVARLGAGERVRYVPQLQGCYDLLLATDVFEHVADPVAMLADTLGALAPGGRCLFANCFWPVIACHLPQHFHLRHSWDPLCEALGLQPGRRLAHGRAYRGALPADTAAALAAARAVEARSRARFGLIEVLPRPLASRLGPWLFRVMP